MQIEHTGFQASVFHEYGIIKEIIMKKIILIILVSAAPLFSVNDPVYFMDAIPDPYHSQMYFYTWGAGATNYLDTNRKAYGEASWRIEINDVNGEWSGAGVVNKEVCDFSTNLNRWNLMFWVKGSTGGEVFRVQLIDHPSGDAGDIYPFSMFLQGEDYTPAGITTNWQKISIPLSSFNIYSGECWENGNHHTGIFDWTRMEQVQFMVENTYQTFFVNIDNIMFTTNTNTAEHPFITSPLTADISLINLRLQKQRFHSSFNVPVNWRLIITGNNSGAVRTLMGRGVTADPVWDGTADAGSVFFDNESCTAVITGVDLCDNTNDPFVNPGYEQVVFSISNSLNYYLRVDQSGYRTSGQKQARVVCPADLVNKTIFSNIRSSTFFYIIDTTGSIVYSNTLSGPVYDPASGDITYKADFTPLTAYTGDNFHLEVSFLGRSYPFSIKDDVFKDAFSVSMKALYYQRCGMALEPKYAGAWSRNACHTNDGYYPFNSGYGIAYHIPSRGGWHDAGDSGKKFMAAGIGVDAMLLLCEMFPSKIRGINLNIPESGNHVPDMLNEIRYELDWALTMQFTNGGVCHELDADLYYNDLPERERAKRYLTAQTTLASADFAGMMSIASRVYRPYDAAFADKCLAAAKKAWFFLENNPTILPVNGIFTNFPVSIGYKDSDDSDERFWAAAELFRTTGENIPYNDYVKNNYKVFSNTRLNWEHVAELGAVTYLLSESGDSTVKNHFKTALTNLAEKYYRSMQMNGYPTSHTTNDYFWGSLGSMCYEAFTMIYAAKVTGMQKYVNAAEDELHYILGVNPLDYCFISSLGTKSITQLHHLQSQFDGIDPCVPGLLVGGANKDRETWKQFESKLPAETPMAKCFIDDAEYWFFTEPAINQQGAVVFLSGYFYFLNAPSYSGGSQSKTEDEKYSDIQKIKAGPVPYIKGKHSGGIHFVNVPARVSIRICTVSGTEVKNLNQITDAGEAVWDVRNNSGKEVGRGVYFCIIQDSKREKRTIKIVIE